MCNKLQQPKQQQEKPKLLRPDCPLQILYLNKMLRIKCINNAISAKRQRKRNKQKNNKSNYKMRNVKKMSKQNSDAQCKLLWCCGNDNKIQQQNRHSNSDEAYANPLNQKIKKSVPNVLCDNQAIVICSTTPTITTDLTTCLWLKATITKIHKYIFNSSWHLYSNNNNSNCYDQNINNVQDKLVHTSTKNSEDFKINSGKTSTRLKSSITPTTRLATERSHTIYWKDGLTRRLCALIMLLLLQIMLVNGQKTIVLQNDNHPMNLHYHIQHHMTKSIINSIAISNNAKKNFLYEEITPTTSELTPVAEFDFPRISTAGKVIDQISAETLKQPKNQLHQQQQHRQQLERPKNFNQLIISKTHKASTNSIYDAFKPNHMRPGQTHFQKINSTDVIVVAAGESIDKSLAMHNINNISTYNKYGRDIYETLITSQPKVKQFISDSDNQKLLKLVKDGLGLQQLPDMRKANISQLEYANKYKQYLQRLHERQRRERNEERESLRSKFPEPLIEASLQFLTLTPNASITAHYRSKRNIALAGSYADNSLPRPKSARTNSNEKNSILLHFPLNMDVSQLHPDDIQEANIRFMLIHNAALAHKPRGGKRNCATKTSKNTPISAKQKHVINLRVYELLSHEKRSLLDGRKIEVEFDRSKSDQTYSQWLQFDVTAAVQKWLRSPNQNLGLEIKCTNCHRLGARILNDASSSTSTDQSQENVDLQLMPVLNIIGRSSGANHKMHPHKLRSRSSHPQLHQHMAHQSEEIGKTDCHKDKLCCRHSMEVVFEKIQGYQFILHPKVFDAGYCRGGCPEHYNLANNHAVLQSLIRQQDKKKAPRTCCAPSKLVELEILHLDENDTGTLKISTWTDMRVTECACT